MDRIQILFITCVGLAILLAIIQKLKNSERYEMIAESPEQIKRNSRKNLINVFGEDSGYILN